MLNMQEEKNGPLAMLTLSGDIIIENISQLHEKLMGLYNDGDSVCVRIDGDSTTDFTFFQLMCSAARSFGSAGKEFSIDCPRSGPQRSRARSLGFTGFGVCTHGECKHCLWAVKESSDGKINPQR